MIRLGQFSSAEDALEFQLRFSQAPPFERQRLIAAGRRFKADFYFPTLQLVVEVDGGGFVAGRHSRGQGIENDCEKSAYIARMPSRLIRVTPRQVKDGRALQWILECQ